MRRLLVIALLIPALCFAGTINEIQVEQLPWGAHKPALNINAQVLAANTAETHTFATSCAYAYFASNGDFYARWDGSAATVPAADISDGSGSELNPQSRYVVGQATVSLIAPVATVVTIACYKWTR